MKKIMILVFSFFSVITFSQNYDFEDNIRKMLEIQGIEKNWETVIKKMIQIQKESNPEIDSKFWIRFEQKILQDSYSELFNMIVPIYKKHLTEDEVNSIIEFYESDAGRSLISKTPMILLEAMDEGGKLGETIAKQIIQEIEKEKTVNYQSVNSGCEAFKKGKFKFQMPDSTFVEIERDYKFQYEYYNGTTTKYKINWLNDCRYSLIMVKSDNETMNEAKGQILITNIYDTGSNYYKFVSTIEDRNFKLDGIIYKIE